MNKFFLKTYFKSYSAQELKGKKYIYYPLHKEPELALNFHAPHLSDQMELVKFISISIPGGYKLLIKEHIFKCTTKGKKDDLLEWVPLGRLDRITLSGPHRRWVRDLLKIDD